MADRYWVGGAGTWSNTSTTNWAATSGGANGASAPTTADSIFFDANSGVTPFTVTVSATTPANCQNMTVSVGNITFGTGAGAQTVTINGNLDLHSQTTWSATSQVQFRTTGSQTTQINSNSVLINGQVSFFANTSGTINLASNLAVVNTQNIRLISNGGGIEGNGFWMTTAANLTSDGGVATTINNLRANTTYLFSGGSQTVTLGGTCELPNFSYSSTNSLSISANANITVGNAWNISAVTTRTLSLGANSRVRVGASAASGSNVFVANNASNLTISTGSNSGVVVAYTGSSSNTINVFSFGTSFVEANSIDFYFPAGSHTINVQGSYRDMNFTGFSGNLALVSIPVVSFGNVTFSSTMNTSPPSTTQWFRFASATQKAFDPNGVTVNFPVQVTGRMRLSNNLTLAANNTSNGWFSINGNATANLNGFNLTTSNLTFVSGSTESANLDYATGGNVNINNNQGGVVFSANTTGSLAVQNAANGNLNINLYTGNATTIYVGQPGIGFFNYKILSGTGNLTILPGSLGPTNPILGNIDFTGFTGNVNVAANTFFQGTVTLDPALTVRNSGFYWIFSRDANIGLTSPNITTNGRVIDAPTRFIANRTLQGNATLGTTTGYVCEANSGIISLNNNALICHRFDGSNTAATKTVDFGTSGQIICTGNNVTVLNLPSTNVTLSGNILISSNGFGGTRTFTLGNYASNFNVAISGANLNLGTAADTVTFTGNIFNFDLTGMNFTYSHTATGNIFGNFTVPATGGTFTSTANVLSILTTSPNTSTITVNRTIDLPVTFNGNGTYTLANNLTVGNAANNRTLTMTQGTFNFANFVVTTQNFVTTGTAVRALNFSNSGYIVLNPATTTTSFNGGTTNLTVSGSAQVFSNSTGAFQRTITTSSPFLNFTFNEPAGSFTVFGVSSFNDITINSVGTSNNSGITIYGNLVIASTATAPAAGTTAWTFASNSNTKTITTNGKLIDWPLTFNGVGGTWALNDALTMGSTRGVTLTAGTFNMNNFSVSANAFSSTGTGVRNITFGSAAFTLTGSGVSIIDIQNASNFSYTGTPYFNSTYTGATGTRTILLGNATQGNFNDTTSFDVSVTGSSGIIANTGTDTLAVTGHIGNLNLTGMQFANFSGGARFIYKNFTVPATGGNMQLSASNTVLAGNSTQTVTVNRSLDFPIVIGNGTSQGNVVLANNLTLGSTRTLFLTSGNLTFNDFTTTSNAFSSTGANSRTLAFGSSGNMLLTGNGVTIWDTTNAANFITTGTQRVFANYNSNLGTRTVTFGNIAETYTFNVKFASAVQADAFTIRNTSNDAVSISNNMRDFDFTSSNSNLNNTTRTVYGNFTIPATGGNIAIGTAATTFAATSGNYTIDTTARTLQFPLTFNSTGGANYTISNNLVANATTVLTLSGGNINFNQRSLTFANITVLTGGNSSISNLSTTIPFVQTSGNLTILSGAINCATTNTYTLTSGILNVSANFSTGAFTHTAGNIIL